MNSPVYRFSRFADIKQGIICASQPFPILYLLRIRYILNVLIAISHVFRTIKKAGNLSVFGFKILVEMRGVEPLSKKPVP